MRIVICTLATTLSAATAQTSTVPLKVLLNQLHSAYWGTDSYYLELQDSSSEIVKLRLFAEVDKVPNGSTPISSFKYLYQGPETAAAYWGQGALVGLLMRGCFNQTLAPKGPEAQLFSTFAERVQRQGRATFERSFGSVKWRLNGTRYANSSIRIEVSLEGPNRCVR